MKRNSKVIMILIAVLVLIGGFLAYHVLFSSKAKITRMFNDAQEYHLNMKLEKAKDKFNEILEIDPLHEDANLMLAVIYMSFNDYKKAEEIFLTVLKNSPDNKRINGFLGSLYTDWKKYEKAKTYVEKAIKDEPKSSAHLDLGIIHYNENRFSDAEKEFITHIKNFNGDPEGYMELGYIYVKQGKILEGVKNLRKSCELDGMYIQAIINIGEELEKEEKYEEAEKYYKKISENIGSPKLKKALERIESKLKK